MGLEALSTLEAGGKSGFAGAKFNEKQIHAGLASQIGRGAAIGSARQGTGQVARFPGADDTAAQFVSEGGMNDAQEERFVLRRRLHGLRDAIPEMLAASAQAVAPGAVLLLEMGAEMAGSGFNGSLPHPLRIARLASQLFELRQKGALIEADGNHDAAEIREAAEAALSVSSPGAGMGMRWRV